MKKHADAMENNARTNMEQISSKVSEILEVLNRAIEESKNVEQINVNMYAKALEQITVSPENQNLKAEDGILYSKDGKSVLYCPKAKKGTVTICSGTAIIGASSFELCKGITEIKIPSTVTKVKKDAFATMKKGTVFLVPAGTKEFYESLLTKETGFISGMKIKEVK